MRVAVIYRPRNTPPFELMPQLMQGMAEWTGRYQDRMETAYFFAGGGGFGVLDIDDSAELQRMLAEHPFTRSPTSRSGRWSTPARRSRPCRRCSRQGAGRVRRPLPRAA